MANGHNFWPITIVKISHFLHITDQRRIQGGHGAMPQLSEIFPESTFFNEFSDSFGFDYWLKQWNNHIHHAMYIVFIHSQSELSVMYILAAL